MSEKGKVITFYSFKGGVGRSMALANIACLLAKKHNKRVLMLDWDLDAPGLHQFFHNAGISDSEKGLIDFFVEIQDIIEQRLEKADNIQEMEDHEVAEILDSIKLNDYILKTDIPSLDIMTCGRKDEKYSSLVSNFDWVGLFGKSPNLFYLFAERLTQIYEYVLIDSRTGYTDTSGICTMLMPEILVLVFTPNKQSISGVIELLHKATDYRKQSDDFRPLMAFPLPTRIDNAELERKNNWRMGNKNKKIKGYQPEFENAFKEVYGLTDCKLDSFFNKIQVPYVPYYAYGEEIAVLRESGKEVNTLSESYGNFKNILISLDAPWEYFEEYKQSISLDSPSEHFEEYRHSSSKEKTVISYATEDYKIAKRLYDDLKNAGTEPWLDLEDLLPGQDWKTTISQVIRNCRYCLLLISEHSVSKQGYIQKEQKIVLELLAEFPLNEIYIIPAKIDNTEPIDERLKNIHPADLSDYEKGLKQIIKVLTLYSDTTQQEDKQLDFVIRSSELQLLTSQHTPSYLLIVGPLGYGKTKLFEVVRYKLRRQWLCVSITISEKIRSVNDIAKDILISVRKNKNGDFDFKTSEEAGLEVGSYILEEVLSEDRKKLLIQIDEAENLEENTVKELVNRFIPAIADTLHHVDATLNVMFAGRYISNWQQLSYEIQFKPILLAPFDFDAVYQTVANFDFSSKKAGTNIEYQKEFSARLMFYTGGHIRAMSQILTKYYRLPMKVIIKKEEDFYQIVKPVIDDIKNHIQPDLKDIMETLSVVRRFNPCLLQNFIQNKFIEWNQSEFSLEDSLLQTYLLNIEGGFLIQGDINRRLLAIDLLRNDLHRFVKICDHSISFYEDRLHDPKTHGPDIIAVELLFQKLQFIYYKEKGNKEDFFKVLPDILNILVSGRDAIIIMENFIQLLNQDWEFRFTFNYLFRERSYDDRPFNEFMEKVINFLEFLKKRGQNL